MTTIVFDTHATFKRLIAAGLSEAAAEAMAGELLAVAQEQKYADTAKRLSEVQLELETFKMQIVQHDRRYESYQSDIRSDLERLELRLRYDLTLRLGGVVAVGVAFLTAIKFFGH